MVRTITMTYQSYNPIYVKVITENGSSTKTITFDRTQAENEVVQPKTVTKVIGVRAKFFELEIQSNGSRDDVLEISKVSVSYG